MLHMRSLTVFRNIQNVEAENVETRKVETDSTFRRSLHILTNENA